MPDDVQLCGKGFPFYRFSGTHRESGRQLGEECSIRRHRHRDLVLERLASRDGIPVSMTLESALFYRSWVVRYPPCLDEEIMGVAEGASLTPAEAYVPQLRAELASPEAIVPSSEDERHECATFAVLSGATVDQIPPLGRTPTCQ